MALAGQVHSCWKCTKRLNVDNVAGSVAVICPKCHAVNTVRAAASPAPGARYSSREQARG